MAIKIDIQDELPWIDSGTDVTIVSELSKRHTPETPDFIDRKLDRHIPVFVYGTLKKGLSNHYLLEGAPYLGSAITDTARFYMRETEHFPIVFEANGQKKVSAGKIFGEVYVVDPKRLLQLDRLEGNGYMYQRELVWTKLLDQDRSTALLPHIKTWMYVGVPSYFSMSPLGNVKGKEASVGMVYEWSKSMEKKVMLI